MTYHLTDEQLLNYIYDMLSGAEWQTLNRHLATCDECRARLAQRQRLQQRIQQRVSLLQRETYPPTTMNFMAIAPGLRRARGFNRAMYQSRQLLYGAATLAVLVALGIALYAIFSGIGRPDPVPPQVIDQPTVAPTPAPAPEVEFVWQISGEPNPLKRPSGLGLDADGNIYVVDTVNDRLQKFSGNGQPLLLFGSYGTGPGQFDFRQNAVGPGTGAGDVVIDSRGNIYVADGGNARIQKFDTEGQFITQWGSPGPNDGQFGRPLSLAIDEQDNIYVLDDSNPRVQKFNTEGQFLAGWGSVGALDGQFSTPGAIAVDQAGNIYQLDRGTIRVQVFDSQGAFRFKWGVAGTGEGQLLGPVGLTVDNQGRVYVTERDNSRVQIFDSRGTFLTRWGSPGTSGGQFNYPFDVAVDAQGNIYVSDYNNHTIQKFRLR